MSFVSTLKSMLPVDLLQGLYHDLGPENFITLLAAFSAFLMVVFIWRTMLVRDPLAGRAKVLAQHRGGLRDGLLAPRRRRQQRTFDSMGVMRQVTQKLNLMRSRQAGKITEKLAQAGWRTKDALTAYLFAKVAMPFALGGLVAMVVYGMNMFGLEPMGKLVVATLGVVLGAYAPEIYVRNAATKRRQALQKGLPDALDLMVICTEAGLALDAALTRVAGEMARSCPEIADEFGLAAVELGFLPERRKALENLNRRTDMASIRGVVNTLLQTEKYGTPLAQSLRVLATEYRNDRMMKAEEKAAKLPATMTVPLVVFILPTLFIVLIGPAILRAIDGLGGL